jgi:hypothetical protein
MMFGLEWSGQRQRSQVLHVLQVFLMEIGSFE